MTFQSWAAKYWKEGYSYEEAQRLAAIAVTRENRRREALALKKVTRRA